MKIFYLSLILGLSIHIAKSQETSIDNWTKYLGWHYSIPNAPDWGKWIREGAKNGFGLNIIDKEANSLNVNALNDNYNKLLDLSEDVDILQLDGGLGSARDTAKVIDWMNMIETDSAKSWKNIVYQQSFKIAGLPNSENRVYWQIGNEISSPAYSRTIRYWLGEEFGDGKNYDLITIPYYVENYFAPTVEAIDSASFDFFGEKGKIKICLGSITNARSLSAQIFLDSLLNYQVIGTNAHSLKGKYVKELFHIITVHYILGTSSTESWQENIEYYKNFTGMGRINGVWCTEEVGIKASQNGEGSFIGSIATARCLEWCINKQYHAREARINYYGWNTGSKETRLTTFNDSLFNFLGNIKLLNISKEATSFNATNLLEYHGFLSENKNKSFLIVFPERNTDKLGLNIQSIILNKQGWGDIDGVRVYKYNNEGIVPITISINKTDDHAELSFNGEGQLENRDGILVLATNNNASTSLGALKSEYVCKLYPNPLLQKATLQIENKNRGSLNLTIYNVEGNKMRQIKNIYEGEVKIERGELTSGVYILTIQSENSLLYKRKFIVQ